MNKVRIADVAKKAGVSTATVSRVIHKNGYVAEALRERIETVINEMGYTSNRKPSAVPVSRKLIGFITHSTPLNYFYENLSREVVLAAAKRGFCVIPRIVEENQMITDKTIELLIKPLMAFRPDGVIIAGFMETTLSSETRKYLQSLGVPIVFIERVRGCYGFNQVCIDNSICTYRLTMHLINKGHKHLAYLDYALGGSVEEERRTGFLQAIRDNLDKNVQHTISMCMDATPDAAVLAIQEALQNDPDITGVVTYYDTHAAGVLQHLYQAGIRVPDKIEVVGNDNVLASLVSPPISSVQAPFKEMADAAVDMVVSYATDSIPKKITLEPRLVIR